jgi:hypothetical protein
MRGSYEGPLECRGEGIGYVVGSLVGQMMERWLLEPWVFGGAAHGDTLASWDLDYTRRHILELSCRRRM